jgi:hypothetical protein
MFANEQQELALVHDAFAIQVQLRNRSAANRGETDHHCVVIAPGEMLVPIVFARMKERDCFPAERVNGGGLVVLEIVTALASSREVIRAAFATSGQRDDVLIGESVRAVIFLADAVFAATLRALFDQQPQFFGKPPSSHEEQA